MNALGSQSNNRPTVARRPLRHGVAIGRASRPTNFVAAALPDRAASDRAIEEIVAGGIPRAQVAVLHGDVGAEAISDGRRRSRSWLDLSDEARYVERYERAARAGAWVIGVELSGGARGMRDRVRTILLENGGHSIVSRSRWTHAIDG